MMSGRFGSSRRDVLRLFEGGSVAGLGDGELLERFAVARDEAAFEALVAKLGPMVLGVCRRMLSDPHDVDDAFQATFLVLVRRAGSIRDRDLVGPWLHGVATKVARRARAESIRRSSRERVAVVAEAREESIESESDWPELRAMIDEEIERLPENHRRPVILCDVEGLTREEAALQLGWSLNMVRGRLERARSRLRGRLTRRGLAPSCGLMALLATPPTLSPVLLAMTCRAACSFAVGRLGAGVASASAVALCRGVLKMMLLSKLKVGLAVVILTGFVATGTGMLAAQGAGEKQEPAKPSEPFRPRSWADLAQARLDTARQRLEAQMAFYDEGRITIDRLIDASRGVMQAELDVHVLKAIRVDAARAHYDRLNKILKHEEAELKFGRATKADVSEIKTELLYAEFTLAKEMEAPEAKPAAKAGMSPQAAPASTTRSKLNAERVEIARRIFDETRDLFQNARVDLEVCLNAWKSLLAAVEDAATTKAARIEAIQRLIEVLKNMLLPIVEARVNAARAAHSSIDQVRLLILDTEAHLIEVSEAPEGPGEGVAPTPNGMTPVIGPGSAATQKKEGLSSLGKAVDDFNQNAMTSAIGRDQPPLTEDEVIAAIRFYSDENPGTIEGALDDFRLVSEKRDMPPGMELVNHQMDDRDGDFAYEVWLIQIQMPNKRGGHSMIPIRSRVIRSLTLEEAIKYADAKRVAASQSGTPEGRKTAFAMEEYIKSLEYRIRQRGKPNGGVRIPSIFDPRGNPPGKVTDRVKYFSSYVGAFW
jgi:RNA polymerase sigma factor (sigma-70 family)